MKLPDLQCKFLSFFALHKIHLHLSSLFPLSLSQLSEIKRFMASHFTPSRMVLVGVNVDHAQLVELAEEHFVDPQTSWSNVSTSPVDESISQYTGGMIKVLYACTVLHDGVLLYSGYIGRGQNYFGKLLSFCVWQILIGRHMSLSMRIVNENSGFNFGKC